MIHETKVMPFLYILMRSDLESMNPGKSVAQGCHAANQFVHEVEKLRNSTVGLDRVDTHEYSYPWIRKNIDMYDVWDRSGNGFGTTICLGVDYDQLTRIVLATTSMGMLSNITHDPSYPIRDGSVTHFIPLDTCGYVFGDKDELRIILGQFNLLP